MGSDSHRYLPTGSLDLEEMLEAIGVASVDDLFSTLPAAVRLTEPPAVEGPLSDQELRRFFRGLASRNLTPGEDVAAFLGGGAYRHETPASLDHLLYRAEFFSVYTPYQPEVSQGTLQAIFEFQTLISMLTGLPVANASMYDGASGFAEAVLMTDRVKRKRHKAVVSRGIHPEYRATLESYVQNLDLEVVEVGWDEQGRTDAAALERAVDDDTLCVAVQSPNHFGVIEPWEVAARAASSCDALSIAVVTEALSLAMLRTPGDAGCDIAVGEGQSFGLPVGFGGPYVGFLATRDEFKRAIPGRLVGETVDAEGRRAWVLTLATREQHIRREKATSNICTNQSLCALAATIYLALHGRVGLARLAEINVQRAATVRRRLFEAGDGLEAAFRGPIFNEFAVRSARPVDEVLAEMREAGVLAGVPLGPDYPELEDCWITAVTECNPPEEIDRLAAAAARMARTGTVETGAGR